MERSREKCRFYSEERGFAQCIPPMKALEPLGEDIMRRTHVCNGFKTCPNYSDKDDTTT